MNSNVVTPKMFRERTGGSPDIKQVVAEHKVTRNSKSRDNWRVQWCGKRDCKWLDTQNCGTCIKWGMYEPKNLHHNVG